MYKASVVGVDDERTILEITVDESRVSEAVARALRRVGARVSIPGFRKGRAPRALLERFVSREAIYDEAIQDFAPEAYEAALRETGLRPVDEPEFDGLSDADLETGDPLVFKVKFTASPEVKLGDYTAIKLDREQREVTDLDVDRTIQNLREQRAEYVPTERATVETDDLVTVDIDGYVDGELADSFSAHDVEVVVGSGQLIPGLDEKIVGMNVGQPQEFVVSLPETSEEGQKVDRDVTFKVSVRDIKAKQLPDLDDDFAKDMGGADTLAGLRDKIMHSLRHRALDEAVMDLARRALSSLVTTSEVEIPRLMIDREADEELDRLQRRLAEQGLEWEQYLAAKGKSEDEIRGELREAAPGSVKAKLVVDALGEKQELMPTSDEVSMAIYRMSFDTLGDDQARLRKLMLDPDMRRAATDMLVNAKVLAFLGRSCDADPDSARCDECTSEAGEARANDSEGEAQE
ncbi:MAG TPA: trigger factor [Bacillota bacterium]|nr:trigger factor [Bacillota bacterium]